MKRFVAKLLILGLAVTSLETPVFAAETTEDNTSVVAETDVTVEETSNEEVKEEAEVKEEVEAEVKEEETEAAKDSTEAKDETTEEAAVVEEQPEAEEENVTATSVEVIGETYYFIRKTDDINEATVVVIGEGTEESEIPFADFTKVDETDIYYYTKADLSGNIYGAAKASYTQLYKGQTSADEYDAVSSATTRKNTLFANTDTSEVTESGYYIYGLKSANVAISKEAYVKASILDAAGLGVKDAYKNILAVAVNENQAVIPSYYLPYDGESFGKAVIRKKIVVQDATAALKYFTRYGTYQLEVNESSTNYLRKTRDNDIYPVNNAVHGAILRGVDANGNAISLGVRHLKEIWVSTYEIAFEPDMNASASFEGGYINSVDYLTADDVYSYVFDESVYVKPVFDTANVKTYFNVNDNKLLTVEGIDKEIGEATLSLSYKEGRTTVSVVDSAPVTVENGVVKVNVEEELIPETAYTVTISNENYADIILSVTPETLGGEEEPQTPEKPENPETPETPENPGEPTTPETPVISGDDTPSKDEPVIDDTKPGEDEKSQKEQQEKEAIDNAVKVINDVVIPYVCAHWNEIKCYIPTIIKYVQSHFCEIVKYIFGF
ncbi:MAG: hypothetical protein IJ535_03420 [Pseudobutyrivibrio sp.]|uniref:hypothetical protein n=1 Tax=Pseudobutyrivibrio sp. TaxID=2014367 RepID=UPI0025DDC7E6|nr:hypothetical protein [Pseudobutyrivibrio sp.]MBQ8488812.1 hypothetical protein [Pseudobutyrivibrio sp.]